jgi:hypothetical protein
MFYQCKREKNFGPSKIKAAVEEFLKGQWASRTDRLILCTQESLEPKAKAKEFENQAEALRQRGITLLSWDERQLSIRLKGLPELVDDFFGRVWVREFCGEEEAERLGERLDAAQVAEYRRRMGRFYAHVFDVQDAGLLIAEAPTPTRDLSALPHVDRLRATFQAMAMLDAILCPDWQYRYYSFNSGWSTGEQMGSMRDGSGDEFFALFNPSGCWIKGFAHEAPMSPYRDDSSKRVWPGVLDDVPTEFAACLSEPAFAVGDTTFCIWRRYGDTSWNRGQIEFPDGHRDPDGSEDLMSPLDGQLETYRAWAEEYYEREVDPMAVAHVYGHRPLTSELVLALNPEASISDLLADVLEIGYPVERALDRRLTAPRVEYR